MSIAQRWPAWLVWDLLSALLVLAVLLAPFVGLAAGVYLVVQWRKGDGNSDAGRPRERGAPA